MTPTTIMGIALDRVGLTITNGIYRNRARDYLNLVAEEVYARARWTWRFKSGTLATASGTRNYSLASDVLAILSFRDATNDRTLVVVDQAWIDERDADADETGDPVAVALRGLNASTGYWDVDVFPTPTATLSLPYRYYSQWVPLVSTDDDTDLAPRLPSYVQSALLHGTSALYYEEKGDAEMAIREEDRKEQAIQRALERNALAQGDRRDRLQRVGDGRGLFNFRAPEEGALG